MQAWHKEQKAKTIKKGKAEAAKRREVQLSRQNPQKISAQIAALESTPNPSGQDKRKLEELKKTYESVVRLRKKAGDGDGEGSGAGRGRGGGRGRGDSGARARGRGRGAPMHAGVKRRYDGGPAGYESDSGSSTSSSIADIPLPPGPLPPLPGEHVEPVITTYEAAPIIRNLQKEAVSAFMPAAVQKQLAAKQAKLAEKRPYGYEELDEDEEEEDLEALEREMKAEEAGRTEGVEGEGEGEDGAGKEESGEMEKPKPPPAKALPTFGMMINAAPDVDVDEEVARFQAVVEEVDDDGS